MSVENPAYSIARQPIAGHEGDWVKMFDPPVVESVPTPELCEPTNPVPTFMFNNGFANQRIPLNTLVLNLKHDLTIPTWDSTPENEKELLFYAFRDPDIPQASGGVWPGPTIRIPRGVIFHCRTDSSGGPHTIHWHGIEPSPINDGVGHCSMELGEYTYQFQPNHIGTYFYHCHRNTMQHFEFGLYGLMIVEPPDAFNGSDAGKYPRRTAANLTDFPQFPDFNSNPLESMDPHAMTVAYDYEAAWVIDDADSVWREKMRHHADTFPKHGTIPGVNDRFFKGDFHDFNPDYFYVTGQPFRGPLGGTGDCDPNIVIPTALNSGVEGMQVSVNAQKGKTVLVRVVNAAYVNIKVTFPVDVVIIAFDGRALGVPPFGRYNHAFKLPAGMPYTLSVARRFDALIRSDDKVENVFAEVEYRHNRDDRLLFTGRIPMVLD
jgi:FtsP/CotA-like multicopper oxidase with cupredoxin domain